MMRELRILTTSIACLLGALGCRSNLTTPDSGTRGSAGIGPGGEIWGQADWRERAGGEELADLRPGAWGSTAVPTPASMRSRESPARLSPVGTTSSCGPSPPRPGCPCTRTPGPGNSFQCPMGAGQTSYATIGAAGGQIMLLGQQSKATKVPLGIIFPPGALATDTRISVTETDLPPPTGIEDWSPVYLVEPRGLELAKVASLQIPWSSNLTAVPNTLGIYARDENGSCAFNRLVDSYTNAGFEQASLTEFSSARGSPLDRQSPTCGAERSAGGRHRRVRWVAGCPGKRAPASCVSTPSSTGVVHDPVSGVFGSWYPFGDGIGPNATTTSTDIADSDCVRYGSFPPEDCSKVDTPVAGSRSLARSDDRSDVHVGRGRAGPRRIERRCRLRGFLGLRDRPRLQ